NDLLETSPIRPVTPVGQLLFNEQKRATENAIFHKMSPQEALARSEAIVQQQLDRSLSPPRGFLVPWKYFLGVYALFVLAAVAAIYVGETHIKGNHRFRQEWLGGWASAAPWIIGFIVFTGGPLLFSIIISFCDYDVLNPARFVGLANYRSMFTQDPLFWKSIANTAFMVIGIPLGMALSLAMAMLLNLQIRGVAIWRTFFYLPSIVPAVTASILWVWILNPNIGLLNNLLWACGILCLYWFAGAHPRKHARV